MIDYLLVLLSVLLFISLIYVIAIRAKRIDVVDIAWGGAFIVAALVSFFVGDARSELQALVTLLVVVWGVRLGTSIYGRYKTTKKEDERYTELRKKWKGNVNANIYVRIFLVQGLLATLIASSVIIINLADKPTLELGAFIGFLVWSFGFFFETVGDMQLKQHLANPKNKGKILTLGLWKYSRHPNYFGEATQWWGVWLIALSVPFGWLTVIAPLTITGLLLFFSGVPMTEKRFEGRPGWKEYKAKTSVFLPLPPKKV